MNFSFLSNYRDKKPSFSEKSEAMYSSKYCILFHSLFLKRFIPDLCGFWQRYSGVFQKQISKTRVQLNAKMVSQPESVPLLKAEDVLFRCHNDQRVVCGIS